MKDKIKIPESAIRRLSLYFHHLASLKELGVETISSREIATVYGLAPFQVRKDLSYFGAFGRRGRGYNVAKLMDKLGAILGLDRSWNICLVGAGNIGLAMYRYQDFKQRGFNIVAVFDSDPKKAGQTLKPGMAIQSMDQIEQTVNQKMIQIGIIAVPPQAAQAAVDKLAAAGVKAILFFPSSQILIPKGIALRRVNLGLDLEFLSYALTNN
ncbi:MAG: redox-sensing transcriptional repressor Rex [Candidatus Edwardsbacteria bacterium RIFOXYD12_FULL_50_11]|uniref:Redox-sensing transcriptional repressor Rex n=1 Tax=Candidatus Edwardsbacteria bacterium GWF2_54_11 TaxID=1817851 RepID=A0A1F5REU0_9BACT|nr:MAG: redox-sensing transcriptional repressor Rex [Candidatus Edwardsbacteria bacterium RifOxyC12_full_54_24]OGF09035.1 MAG: redox-sensing transcriptional repressor Rex [Candidatus Edwardsbacteria bacterium RifOxyA12_full_54_48]OGF12439.1 MAG: redox-sensing transcriptional repressor Rex [Candidatus Edwardsbacteria bacterium GWE2_54_12]OGF12922.1 MAG: redox-sensing transcriptional repressor Rex [Candidatus Edwardsbacteria bacterium GWF2_54_11]OGF17456.1 MAG: redox-sensing transcriptional repre